jgi:hypothetical protein
MEEVIKVNYTTYVKSGMTMSLSDIGSIRTLTVSQCEELIRNGDIKEDMKFKRKRIILNKKGD